MIGKILVPVDLSSVSERAIELAIESALAYKASILVTAVVREASASSDPDQPPNLSAKETLRYLEPIVEKIAESVATVSIEIVEGDPAAKILELARQERVDMVVMATHARSGLTRGILGSVTDNVLRNSGIPVLAIRSEFVSYLPKEGK